MTEQECCFRIVIIIALAMGLGVLMGVITNSVGTGIMSWVYFFVWWNYWNYTTVYRVDDLSLPLIERRTNANGERNSQRVP